MQRIYIKTKHQPGSPPFRPFLETPHKDREPEGRGRNPGSLAILHHSSSERGPQRGFDSMTLLVCFSHPVIYINTKTTGSFHQRRREPISNRATRESQHQRLPGVSREAPQRGPRCSKPRSTLSLPLRHDISNVVYKYINTSHLTFRPFLETPCKDREPDGGAGTQTASSSNRVLFSGIN